MKELSLNILDIAENSVKAGASLTEILIDEDDEKEKEFNHQRRKRGKNQP